MIALQAVNLSSETYNCDFCSKPSTGLTRAFRIPFIKDFELEIKYQSCTSCHNEILELLKKYNLNFNG
jgi:hypothetical protein